MRNRLSNYWYLAFALVVVGAVVVGLVCWLNAEPAVATPGATCAEPTPGHCHSEPTTTTEKPTTTTAKPTTTTAKPTTTTKGGTGTTGATTSTTAGNTSTTGAATSTTSTTAGSTSTPGTATSTTVPAGGTGTTGSTAGSVSPTSQVPTVGPASSSESGEPRYLDQNNCLACHGDPSLAKTLPDGTSVSLFVDTDDLPQAVHRYKDCTACHTSDPHAVASPLTKVSQADKCGSCHQYEYGQYTASVHGVPQPGGNSDPATCADCHAADSNPHNVVRVLEPESSTYPKNVAQTCAKCHNNPELMDKYGIVEKVYDTYMRSFHGKAMKLAPGSATIRQLDTATCINCHGSHNIKSVSDPAAPVAGMENLLSTCQLCHTDAGPEFVKGFLGHKAANSEFLPEVYWGGKTFYIFSRAILAGGALIVATSIGLRGVPWIRRRFKSRDKKED